MLRWNAKKIKRDLISTIKKDCSYCPRKKNKIWKDNTRDKQGNMEWKEKEVGTEREGDVLINRCRLTFL